MKKSRYTEEQIIGAVKQLEAGRSAPALAREKPRYGHRRLWALLRTREPMLSLARVYRL